MNNKFQGYWLHENGEVIHVESNHFSTVENHPEKFGYTVDELRAIQNKFKPIQRASDKIISQLIKNRGWIRIHYKPEKHSWIVQLHTLTDNLKELLIRYFSDSSVKITNVLYVHITEMSGPKGMRRHEVRLSDLYDRDFFGEKRAAKRAAHLEKERRTNFLPYLMRVGSTTRPSQIVICGLFGLERCFFVGAYRELLNEPLEKQLIEIKSAIEADKHVYNGSVPFFGAKKGYAFYPEYGKCIAMSSNGEVLENVRVEHCSGSLCISKVLQSCVEIPKFVFESQTDSK